MIIKAKERGGGAQIARYLLTMRDNDHVELHEVRGFVSDDLRGAFLEADAIAEGTRCTNHLFSISLNPPQDAAVTVEEFEAAANEVERKLGLENQPRAIVFHEEDGRRHAHVVWSRIDAGRMRAINLPHDKLHMRDVSRELFRAHGWEMPKGLRDWKERDPLRFTREEWQQARRTGLDPKQIKALFQKAWSRSDSGVSFAQALRERGFTLARGDRRGVVAVDYRGEVYAVARQARVKTKDVAARLGDLAELPSVKPLASRCCALQQIFGGVHQTFEASPAPETTWKGQAENGKGGSHEHDHHNARPKRAYGSRIRRIAPVANASAGKRRTCITAAPQYLGVHGKHHASARRQSKAVPAPHTLMRHTVRLWRAVFVLRPRTGQGTGHIRGHKLADTSAIYAL